MSQGAETTRKNLLGGRAGKERRRSRVHKVIEGKPATKRRGGIRKQKTEERDGYESRNGLSLSEGPAGGGVLDRGGRAKVGTDGGEIWKGVGEASGPSNGNGAGRNKGKMGGRKRGGTLERNAGKPDGIFRGQLTLKGKSEAWKRLGEKLFGVEIRSRLEGTADQNRGDRNCEKAYQIGGFTF